MNPSTSTTATASLSPDSPSSTRARRRSRLDPRSTEKMAAPSVAATIEPSSRPSSRLRSRSHVAGHPHHGGGDEGARGGQRNAGAQHGPDLREARGQAALEEDQRQSDDPDRPGQLDVLQVPAEIDQAEDVRSEQHPHAEEEHEPRHPEPARDEGGGDAERQQRAGDQDQGAVGHRPASLCRQIWSAGALRSCCASGNRRTTFRIPARTSSPLAQPWGECSTWGAAPEPWGGPSAVGSARAHRDEREQDAAAMARSVYGRSLAETVERALTELEGG